MIQQAALHEAVQISYLYAARNAFSGSLPHPQIWKTADYLSLYDGASMHRSSYGQ